MARVRGAGGVPRAVLRGNLLAVDRAGWVGALVIGTELPREASPEAWLRVIENRRTAVMEVRELVTALREVAGLMDPGDPNIGAVRGAIDLAVEDAVSAAIMWATARREYARACMRNP